MTSIKMLCVALIVLLAGAGLSVSISEALLELTEIADLEDEVADDLEKSLTTINRFFCGGVSFGDSLVGVSFTFLTGDEKPLTRDGLKDTSRDLASRSVAIPFLRGLSKAYSFNMIIDLFFLPYSLQNVLISASNTELIRLFANEEWVGAIVVVKKANLTVSDDKIVQRFIDYYIDRLDIVVDKEPLQHSANIIEYIDSNHSSLEIDHKKMWRVWLYGSAVNLNLKENVVASEMIHKLPENAGDVFSAKAFDDNEFLLAGDIFLIFGEEEKAFNYWAYGMQVNPLNKTLEERFEKYDNKD
ncbi:hypothetical protein [Mesotoga sp. UBA5847]|uniref:hypothetical protein n=1 Tax=Mesotoga sp. UBA5847 TaxID=1946859 RepID=UPI0025E9391B|nr:hypothetical protein [Mesotoga sp. UBA5847]